MKSFAKVLIILSMISCCWLVVPLIVGIIALNKINKATRPEDLKGIAIVVLLFCNFLAGILLLMLKPSDFAAATPAVQTATTNANSAPQQQVRPQPTTPEEAKEAANDMVSAIKGFAAQANAIVASGSEVLEMELVDEL